MGALLDGLYQLEYFGVWTIAQVLQDGIYQRGWEFKFVHGVSSAVICVEDLLFLGLEGLRELNEKIYHNLNPIGGILVVHRDSDNTLVASASSIV